MSKYPPALYLYRVSIAISIILITFVILFLMTGEKSAPLKPSKIVNTHTCNRIVSLAPSITEVLYALDLDDQTVGVTRYCNYPPEARLKTNIGGYYDPNMEAIVTLKPDLVLMLEEHDKQKRQLQSLGIPAKAVSYHFIEDILQSIDTIGQTCHRQEKAQTLINKLEAETNKLKTKAQSLKKPRVLVSVGRNAGSGEVKDIFIASDNTFYGELLILAGGENAYISTNAMKFPKLSREGILHLNPEIIIDLIHFPLEGPGIEEKVLHEWDSLPQVDAVKNKRVFVFDEEYMVRPSPRYVQILRKMAETIHPDVDWSQS